MANVLSQDEIDALLGGLSGGKIDTAQQATATVKDDQVAVYDFMDQDRFLRSRLPTLETIHDRFSRLMRLSFSTTLRRAVEIQIGNQTICTFGDFSRSVEKPSSLHMVKLEPLKGSGLLVLPARLILSMVDLMFGGNGKQIQISPDRDFTQIEQRVTQKMAEDICNCYTESWSSVHPIRLQIVGKETNIQFVNIAQAGDPVHVLDCDVIIEGSRANLSLCIPFSTLEPIKDVLKGVYVADKDGPSAEATQAMRQQLMRLNVELQAVLGSANLTGRELLNMKPGDIIQLDEDYEHPVEIMVEGRRKFWGMVGAHKSGRALQITGVIEDAAKGN
jgi:flagellar motor switch protein FliM